MNDIWSLELDDMEEIYRRAKENGKKPGDSIQNEFIEYVQEKGIKPIGSTEMSVEEYKRELKSQSKNVLDGRNKKRKKNG